MTERANKDIRTEKVEVSFGNSRILKGISIEAGKKEFVGIIGPNGSGKSTLLKCIYRTLKPDCGAVYLNGEVVQPEDEGVCQEGGCGGAAQLL